MPSALKKDSNLLSSWKEIANYLDCNVRTCTRWEKRYALPVHRIDKASKSRVIAHKDEIDRWLKERFDSSSSPKSIPRLGLKWPKSFYLLLPVAVVVLISVFILIQPKPSQPADFRIENSSLIILDGAGKELWRHDTGIETLMGENDLRRLFQIKRRRSLPVLMIRDIDNDGWDEVLFAPQTLDEKGEGEVSCFSYKGVMLWTVKAGRPLLYGSRAFSADYDVLGLQVSDLDNDGKEETIVLSHALHEFPTQLLVLDSRGKILGEYWNSGTFSDIAVADLDGDGIKEVILSGLNNEYGKGCLVVFDSRRIAGGSPQFKEEFRCRDIAPGSEKYYLLFPRTDVDLLLSPVESLMDLDLLQNRRIRVIAIESSIYYELDYEFRVQVVRFSHGFMQKHSEMKLAGRVHSELNEDYREELWRGIRYFDGEKWVSQPTMTKQWTVAQD